MKTSVEQRIISWEGAALVIRASVVKAEALGIAINVAVADSGGNLAGFLRMPGAFLHSIDIAIDKAYTAAGFGFPTSEWQALLQSDSLLREGLLQRPRLVAFGGGLPLLLDDRLVGAVGVSGGSEEQDEACARAGATVLSRSLVENNAGRGS